MNTGNLSPDSTSRFTGSSQTLANTRIVSPTPVKRTRSFKSSIRSLFCCNAPLNHEAPEPISPSTKTHLYSTTIDPATEVIMYELGIRVIDLFQQVANLMEMGVPEQIPNTIARLVDIIGIIKQIIETDEASTALILKLGNHQGMIQGGGGWMYLMKTLDRHQNIFNDQLKDENTALNPNATLELFERYSLTLRELTADVMVDSGLVEASEERSEWEQVKNFVKRHWRARSEKQKIEDYRQQLSDTIHCLTTTPVIQDTITGVLGQIDERLKDDNTSTCRTIKVPDRTLPTISRYHVKRAKELETMRAHLVETTSQGQNVFPITGMGGCGKSELVAYFHEQHKSLYDYLVVVDASSTSSIQDDLENWVRSLGDEHGEDTWEDALRTLANQAGKWLLVFDNADDITLNLTSFLPISSHGTIIITSRNRDTSTLATSHHLELGEMESEEALSVFLQVTRRDYPLDPAELESAYKIVQELGYLALAIVQAGTYYRQLTNNKSERPYTYTEYLALYSNKWEELLSKPALDGSGSVFGAFNRSYESIPREARDFVHFISFFHSSEISLEILATAANNKFADPRIYLPRQEDRKNVLADLDRLLCSNGEWAEFEVQETISTLRSFSLISTTPGPGSLVLHLHPLVQTWVRNRPESNSQHYATMTAVVLTACSGGSNASLHHNLLPHFLSMKDWRKAWGLHVTDRMAAGRVLMDQGCNVAAEEIIKEAIEVMENVVGDKDPMLLMASEWLTDVYSMRTKATQDEENPGDT